MTMTRIVSTTLLACLFATGNARAYDSDLDPAFSDGTLRGWSKPYFDVGSYPSEHLAGMFRDANGRYLLVGKVCTSANCATFDVGIVRLLGNGAFDTSYGTNGYVRAPQTLLANITAVTCDSHGRFVVVGPTTTSATADVDFGVLRLLPNGAYDPTFAYAPPPLGLGGGRTSIDFGLGGGGNDYPADVLTSAAAAGDYIYVVGQVSTTAGSDVGIALLTPSGQLDGTFGSGGLAHFNFGSDAAPLLSSPTSLAFGYQSLLVAGTARQNGDNPQFALASYYSDGHGFDITFCSNGMCGGGNTGRMLIPAARDGTRPFNDVKPRIVVEDGYYNIYLGGTVIGYAPGSSDLGTDIYIRGFDRYGRNLPGFPDKSFQGVPHGWLNALAFDPTPPTPVSIGLPTRRLVYAGYVTDGNGGSNALAGRFITGNQPGPDIFFFAPGLLPYVTLATPHYPTETHLEGSFSAILFDGPRIVLGGDTFYCCSNTGLVNYDFVAARLVDDVIFADDFEVPN